jgi:hypothetical protein
MATKPPINPDECLATLERPELDAGTLDAEESWRRADLRQSLLTIPELNHVSETALVRAVVQNALGHLPTFDE